MTKIEAIKMVNESLIDQDEKFSREIKALFKTQDVIDLMQQAYDMADDNAKMSLMDATEKQFLDKFAKDGSGDDDEKSDSSSNDSDSSNDDFEVDGSNIGVDDGSDDDFGMGDDGSDDGSDDDFGMGDAVSEEPSNDTGVDDSNPFASMGGDSEPSNPFESYTPNYTRRLNESKTTPRKKMLKRKK